MHHFKIPKISFPTEARSTVKIAALQQWSPMAFRAHQATPFLSKFIFTRCTPQFLHQSFALLSFLTLELPLPNSKPKQSQNPTEKKPTVDEIHVLNQLAHLLPIRHKNSTETMSIDTEFHSEVINKADATVDEFLLPEEKLRGVFLQKLKGKSAICNALTNVDVELSIDIVAKVVNRGNLSGEMMVMFFDWAIERPGVADNVDSYHVILKALGRRKFFTHMVEVLREMRVGGVRPNWETLFVVMDSFVRVRQVFRAMQMFKQLEEFGWECGTEALNVVVRCLCLRGHVATANSLVNKVKGKIAFDGETYNVVIGGWSKLGRVGEIERILKEMVADGFDPDGSTFSFLIEGLGRAGRIGEAVEIFEKMEKETGCAPDTDVYNAMISNFILVGDLDECLKYYEGMLSSDFHPNSDTYIIIIYAFLKARRVADAIEMFDVMLSHGIIPTTGTVTSFIETLCSYGPPHAALMIYKKARAVGCRISLNAYKLLLMPLSTFGKSGMLLNIWDEMQGSGYSSDIEVYEYVINGLCNNGQLENAILLMEECMSKGFCPSRLTCSKLNNKLLASNKIERAYKLFLKIKAARLADNARKHWRAKGWHF